jgi:flagellar basal-body rod protein FlgB
MDLTRIPLFEALAKKMAWLSDRQAVLAQNVANADTPGYTAHDLKPLDFKAMVDKAATKVSLTTTEPGHIAPAAAQGEFAQEKLKGESTLNGNRVSLEEEMMKVSQTANDYALTASLYKAQVGLIKTVLGHGS